MKKEKDDKQEELKKAQQLLLDANKKEFEANQAKLKKFLDDNDLQITVNYQIGVIPKK